MSNYLDNARTGCYHKKPQVRQNVVPCRICGLQESRFRFVKDGYNIVECLKCGLIYLDAAPTIDELRNFYSQGYFSGGYGWQGYLDYVSEKPNFVANAHKRLSEIEKHVPVGRLLDVGCATGFFLDVARERGWEVYGLELSEYAATYAREKLRLNVLTGTLQEASFEPGFFDVVTLWDTIEHVPDPKASLLKIHQMTKEGGTLVLSTGDIDSLFARVCGSRWHLFSIPEHLSFFSKMSIKKLLSDTRFKILSLEHTGSYYGINYLIHSLTASRPSRILSPIYNFINNRRIRNAQFYVNLGDVMTVYAQRTGKEEHSKNAQ